MRRHLGCWWWGFEGRGGIWAFLHPFVNKEFGERFSTAIVFRRAQKNPLFFQGKCRRRRSSTKTWRFSFPLIPDAVRRQRFFLGLPRSPRTPVSLFIPRLTLQTLRPNFLKSRNSINYRPFLFVSFYSSGFTRRRSFPPFRPPPHPSRPFPSCPATCSVWFYACFRDRFNMILKLKKVPTFNKLRSYCEDEHKLRRLQEIAPT